MATGDRQSVFRTTKVRTALKGDNSWIQRRRDAEEEEEEKPWLAEVRASRTNGVFTETSPVPSPTRPAPAPSTESPKSPTSGYLIRGVFTKTDKKPVSSTSTNGHSGTATTFTKKPSEGYKRIAPHTVRTGTEVTTPDETVLSPEEQEKRTEAASNVLRTSAPRQRSYVLSAAKKYENAEKDKPPSQSVTSFVAKRVVLTDEEDSSESRQEVAAPVAAPVPAASTLFLDTSVEESVDEPALPVVRNIPPVPPRESTPENSGATLTSLSDTLISFDTQPASSPQENLKKTFGSNPLPAGVPERSSTETVTITTETVIITEDSSPEPTKAVEEVTLIERTDIEDVKTGPVACVQADPTPHASEGLEDDDLLNLAESEEVSVDPEPSNTNNSLDLLTGSEGPLPQTQQSAGTLDLLADDIIPIDTSATSLSTNQTQSLVIQTKEEEPYLSNSSTETVTITTKTVIITEGSPEEEQRETFDPKPIRTVVPEKRPLPQTQQSAGTLDLLADDIIPIDTSATSLSTNQTQSLVIQTKEEEPYLSNSSTETVTITTKTVIITEGSPEEEQRETFDPKPIRTVVPEKSSAEAYDLISIDTESAKSPLEMFDPLHSDITASEDVSGDALVSLADDIIPMDTTRTRLISNRSWERFDSSSTQFEPSSMCRDEEDVDTQTVVRFEKKSKENDSPWDRWTSPTIYTTTSTTLQSPPETTDTETVTTTTTTITSTTTTSDTHNDPPPDMDSYQSSSRTPESPTEEAKSPDAGTKKGFVYVKEYVNASNSPQDSVSSSSSSYTYGSPSSYSSSGMSACTYCGKLVGNDAKITIEHLNISCHPECFKCGVCNRPMGDFLYSMFLHGGMVHCESCYSDVI